MMLLRTDKLLVVSFEGERRMRLMGEVDRDLKILRKEGGRGKGRAVCVRVGLYTIVIVAKVRCCTGQRWMWMIGS